MAHLHRVFCHRTSLPRDFQLLEYRHCTTRNGQASHRDLAQRLADIRQAIPSYGATRLSRGLM